MYKTSIKNSALKSSAIKNQIKQVASSLVLAPPTSLDVKDALYATGCMDDYIYERIPTRGDAPIREWMPDLGPVDPDCTLGLPDALRQAAPPRQNKHRNRGDYAKQYAKIFALLSDKTISLKDLEDFTKSELARQKLLAAVDEGGNISTFPALKRGTVWYAKHQAEIYNRYAYNLKQIDGEPLFITATMDTKLVNGNPIAAWPIFLDAVKDYLKLMRRHGYNSYISVTESTKRGFPHVHIVAKQEGTHYAHFTNAQGKDKIRYTKDLQAIKDGFQVGYVDIQPANNDSIQGYVFKYLQKAQCPEVTVREIHNPSEKDKVTKSLLGFFFCTCFCTRFTRVSRNLSEPVKAAEKAESIERNESLKAELLDKLASAKSGADLIDLYNKATTKMCPKMFAVSWHGLPEEIKRNPYQIFDPNDEFSRTFRDQAVQIGCPGCPFRDNLFLQE